MKRWAIIFVLIGIMLLLPGHVAAQTCGGTELAPAGATLSEGNSWTASDTVTYTYMTVRFAYQVTGGGSATLYGEINDAASEINASGAYTQYASVGPVPGTSAAVTLTNQSGDTVQLLSACLMEASIEQHVAGRVAQVRQPNAPLVFQGIPAEGLLPWDWENMSNEWGNPLAGLGMNFDFLWKIARIALAFYNMVGGDSAWPIILSFLVVILGVSVLYKILIRPPDI